MKTIFYRIKSRENASYLIEYWSKPDKSNALTCRMVTMEESKVRYMIERETGHVKFDLVFIKDKR